MRRVLINLAWLAFLVSGCSSPKPSPPPATPDLKIANADNPGERLDLESVLVKGKTTVCEFYSNHCPPCQQMAPILEGIAAQHTEVAFRKINIDRASSGGIDFDSPLAEQHQVHSVPAFRIYDADGKLKAEGDEAKNQIREWHSQGQMLQRAERDAGTREILKDYEQH